MDTDEEDRAVDQVVDRLADRFPAAGREHIAAVVDEEHHELDGNPIRDFVPVLVEHDARDRLRSEGIAPTSLTEDPTDPSSGPVA
ncbi:three-helix bundle dimerization domain-containing protein [Agromyces aerolatus]|uniref:three-helix bundle dimerization domain-containing protein n=1 Tax=Agromyces sp. LY-1074 TaxID=3074080 RepID=UPI0028565BB6|nr:MULTISPECIES: hypothetical protein [unclassified Agromyces]MDR5698525.1 hypothetical protein [Agromyces sp. LY-1074]MDR5704819.1 hypothetical protein [Agromyces sp. LY-1358]